MNVGLVAPVFADDPRVALRVAREAERRGVDGVFSYDHLFPINSPDRPALSAIPMLAAMATQTERLRLGTLVSRVTLVPVPVLVGSLATLDALAGGRVIAGIGTGDRLTVPENAAYGMAFPSLPARLRLLTEATRALRALGVVTWIGGRSSAVRAVAAAEADAWNAWNGPLDVLAAFAGAHAGTCQATWGGPLPPDGDLRSHLVRVAESGVTWAVYGPPPSTDWDALVVKLAGAAKAVR